MSAVLAFAVAPAAAEPPRPTADLDGTYLWLGPAGSANYQEARWDSAWGGGAALLRVREARAVGVLGGWIGGLHYAGEDGGRVWADLVVGTRLGGRMLGLAAGPAVELGSDHHPRLGASVAAWAFAGLTPMVRVGFLDEAGAFVELGAHLTLPALRW